MKTDLFQSCGHCWVFQICWHNEYSTFTPSSFWIWNSSTGFPSPPLALFVVMLSKTHLTSQSRMSGSRWVITPSWVSGSWRSFLYSSSAYSCHLVLISSASVRSIPFLSFIEVFIKMEMLSSEWAYPYLLRFKSTPPHPRTPVPFSTSYSRISGSRWMIRPSWLSGSWRSFLYSSSVYSYHLFLISSTSVRSVPFCPLSSPCLHEMFPWYL